MTIEAQRQNASLSKNKSSRSSLRGPGDQNNTDHRQQHIASQQSLKRSIEDCGAPYNNSQTEKVASSRRRSQRTKSATSHQSDNKYGHVLMGGNQAQHDGVGEVIL